MPTEKWYIVPRPSCSFYCIIQQTLLILLTPCSQSSRTSMFHLYILCLLVLAAVIRAQVDLGTAAAFGVLGASTVTNTGDTNVDGDLGVSPGTAVTGFPPGQVQAPGVEHKADGPAGQAQKDASTAYNTAQGLAQTSDKSNTDLGGQTLVGGVYHFDTSAQLTGALVLDAQGNDNAVWVFQIGSTLTTASASSVSFINGGNPCNVFWQVGSSATIGTYTKFAGNVLAYASISIQTGANSNGGLYALTAQVSLDDNQINAQPRCNNPVSSGASSSSSAVLSSTASTSVTSPSSTLASTAAFVNGAGASSTPAPTTLQTSTSSASAAPSSDQSLQPANQPASNQPASNQPASNQPASNQPASNQPASNQPASNQPASNQPASNQPASNQPASNQPASNQPASNQPASNQPASNQPASNQPASNQPASNQPASNQPSQNQPAGGSNGLVSGQSALESNLTSSDTSETLVSSSTLSSSIPSNSANSSSSIQSNTSSTLTMSLTSGSNTYNTASSTTSYAYPTASNGTNAQGQYQNASNTAYSISGAQSSAGSFSNSASQSLVGSATPIETLSMASGVTQINYIMHYARTFTQTCDHAPTTIVSYGQEFTVETPCTTVLTCSATPTVEGAVVFETYCDHAPTVVSSAGESWSVSTTGTCTLTCHACATSAGGSSGAEATQGGSGGGAQSGALGGNASGGAASMAQATVTVTATAQASSGGSAGSNSGGSMGGSPNVTPSPTGSAPSPGFTCACPSYEWAWCPSYPTGTMGKLS